MQINFALEYYFFLIINCLKFIQNDLKLTDLNFLYYYFGCFFKKGPCDVFWYFGALIIMYILTPILCKFNSKSKMKLLFITFLICVIT